MTEVINNLKVKKILEKDEIMKMDYVNFVLMAAASSAKFGVVKEWENTKWFTTRGNIHTLLVMPFGSGKSSSFIDLPNSVYAYNITMPGLMGTITKDGDSMEGSIIKAAGKLLLIDEFQSLGSEMKDAMNSILEYPNSYVRDLGFKLRVPVRRKGKYFYYAGKQGQGRISMMSKFSCIATGMQVKLGSSTEKAWFSRFIPIRYIPSFEYYNKMTIGEKEFKIVPREKEIEEFTVKSFPELHDEYFKFLIGWKRGYFMTHEDMRGHIGRVLQDLTRLSCFVASLDDRHEVQKEDWEYSMKFLNNMLASVVEANLDEKDVFIIENISKHTQIEIANMLDLGTSALNDRVKKLSDRGLIRLTTVQERL